MDRPDSSVHLSVRRSLSWSCENSWWNRLFTPGIEAKAVPLRFGPFSLSSLYQGFTDILKVRRTMLDTVLASGRTQSIFSPWCPGLSHTTLILKVHRLLLWPNWLLSSKILVQQFYYGDHHQDFVLYLLQSTAFEPLVSQILLFSFSLAIQMCSFIGFQITK